MSIEEILLLGDAPALYKVEQKLKALGQPIAPSLLVLLFDVKVQLRRNAAWLLRKYGDPSAVNALVDALDDPDVKVRQFVAITLGTWGDERAIEALLNALNDSNVQVRLNVVRALGHIGDTHTLPALIEILKDHDEDNEVKAAAAQALGRMRAVEAIDALYTALNHRHISIHIEAAMALAHIGEPALNKLVECVQTHQKSYRQRRRSAAVALGWMVGGGHLGYNTAAITLAVETLVAEAGSKDKSIRYEIPQALAATGDLRAIEPLVIGLCYDIPVVRRSAAKALKEMAMSRKIPASALVESMIQAIEDQDAEVRYTAVETLGFLHDQRAIDTLFTCVTHEDHEIRYKAVLALGETGEPSVVKPLSRLLRERDSWLRRCAALSLGKLRHKKAVKPLIIALTDPEPSVRQWAAISLGQIGDSYAIHALEERLKDQDKRVVQAIQVALLQFDVVRG